MKRKTNKVVVLASLTLYFLVLKNKENIRKEVDAMVNLYVTLMMYGIRTFEQVPLMLKPQVKQALIDLELEFLLPEDERPKEEEPEESVEDNER